MDYFQQNTRTSLVFAYKHAMRGCCIFHCLYAHVIFSVTPSNGEIRSHGASSIWPLSKASAVVIAAACEKSELCQEWSSDSEAGEVSSPWGLCRVTHLVQTTAAACMHCAKRWHPLADDPNSTLTRYHTPNLKLDRLFTQNADCKLIQCGHHTF